MPLWQSLLFADINTKSNTNTVLLIVTLTVRLKAFCLISFVYVLV